MKQDNLAIQHDEDIDDRLQQLNAVRDSLFYLQCEARNLELKFLAHLIGVAAECARELAAERDRVLH